MLFGAPPLPLRQISRWVVVVGAGNLVRDQIALRSLQPCFYSRSASALWFLMPPVAALGSELVAFDTPPPQNIAE